MKLDASSRACLIPPDGPFHVVSRPRGEQLFAAGDRLRHVWLIDEGRVRLSTTTAGGLEHLCSLRGPGSLVGFEGLADMAAQRNARIDQDARLFVAGANEVRRWLRKPRATDLVARCAAEEAARCTAERMCAAGTARRRLACFLLQREADPLLAAWREASQRDVACLLALRPETLSRTQAELIHAGLISAGQQVQIVDYRGLTACAAA